VRHELELLRQGSDDQQKSQELETQAVMEVQKVIGQMVRHLEYVRLENGRRQSELGEVARSNEQLLAEVVVLKQWIEVLEQETQQLCEARFLNDCPKVGKDLTNLKQSLGS
jgi:phage host-nuclease inhibitor protein Gam